MCAGTVRSCETAPGDLRARHTSRVSLTGHIDDPDSPVRAYFAAHFPHTGQLQFADTDDPPTLVHTADGDVEWWTQDRFDPDDAHVLPDDTIGYPWALAGTAFDYRLRYEFDVADPDHLVAARGWDELRREPHGQRAPGTAWTNLTDALSQLLGRADPTAGPLTRADALELARLCGVLGLYEQIYRMGGAANPHTWDAPIALAGLDASVDSLLSLVDERLPADIAALVALFRSAMPHLTQFETVVPNPLFARSDDLRGADGDLIVDGLLIEVKTVKTARIGRAFAWQLLGYLLADTDDHYAIRAVGWYYARHGLLWRYPVEEFLHRLAGHDVDLAAARADFADVCATLRKPPRVDAAPVNASHLLAGREVEREVRFYAPTRGGGRWHAPLSQVPWLTDVYPGLDPDAPACGTSVPLNLRTPPRVPPVGVERADSDVRFCRRCLLYTESFYSTPYERPGATAADQTHG